MGGTCSMHVRNGKTAYKNLKGRDHSEVLSIDMIRGVATNLIHSPYVFMAWYFFKHRDKFTFCLYLTN